MTQEPVNRFSSLEYVELAWEFAMGSTAKELAIIHDITRNSVIGRINRFKKAALALAEEGKATPRQIEVLNALGMVHKRSSIRGEAPPPKKPKYERKAPRSVRVSKRIAIHPPLRFGSATQAEKPFPKEHVEEARRIFDPNRMGNPAYMKVKLPPAAPGDPLPDQPASKMLRLFELGRYNCSFPTNDPVHPADTLFCGHDKAPERSYCEFHMRLAYTHHHAFRVKK